MSHDIELDAQVIEHYPAGEAVLVVTDCINETLHRGGRGTLKLSCTPDRLKRWKVLLGSDEELAEFHGQLLRRLVVKTRGQNSAGLTEQVTKWSRGQRPQPRFVNLPQPQSSEQPVHTTQRREIIADGVDGIWS